jgi:protoporphyrinogen oxidase
MAIGILGGGISGLTLQRLLDQPADVLEKAPVVGGLCRTFWKDGFGFDIGGHILFSKYEHVNKFVNELLGDNINYCKRLNTILFKGRYVKYPFENDLGSLEKQDAYECLIDYLKNDFQGTPTNFQEWAYATFGRSIADKYLIPYNRKIWKLEPAEMGLEWVGRVPRPPLEDVVKSALGIPTEGYTHQLYFRYPLHGGFEAVVQAITKDSSRIHVNTKVSKIRKDGKRWVVWDGVYERVYDHLVLAFPVMDAIHCFENVPQEVIDAVAGLRYNALRLAFVAVGNTSLTDRSAVYIPDPTVHPHRVCYMGYFSPNIVRPGTSSLVAETTTRPGDAVDRLSDEAFLDLVVGDLDRVGIVRKEDVIVRDTRRVECAYPVYDRAYGRNVATIRRYFDSLGIDQLGRFAEFDYINSDECIHRAMKLAERLNRTVRQESTNHRVTENTEKKTEVGAKA